MKILGIITARGGSKRVPRKNIKDFLGKPLLAWSIEVGKKAGVFDRFILTTEDKEIAEIGKEYGVGVPFMRPKELAVDDSKSYGAIKHAVEWLSKNEDYKPDWIILLEPTSPGRQAFHIQEVAKIINERNDIDSLIGVSELSPHYHPLKVLKRDDKEIVVRYSGKLIRESEIRNQDFPLLYYSNSAIYAFKVFNLFDAKHSSLWGDRTFGYVMDNKYSFDIDTPEDWVVAEIKMKKLLEGKI